MQDRQYDKGVDSNSLSLLPDTVAWEGLANADTSDKSGVPIDRPKESRQTTQKSEINEHQESSQHIADGSNHDNGQDQCQQLNGTYYYNQNTAESSEFPHPWPLHMPPPMHDCFPTYHQQIPYFPVPVPVPVPVSIIHYFAYDNSICHNDLSSSPDRTPRRRRLQRLKAINDIQPNKPAEYDADASRPVNLHYEQRTNECQSEASSITHSHSTHSSIALSPRRRRRRGRKKRQAQPGVAINENISFHGNSGDDRRAAGENSTSAVAVMTY